MPRTEKYFVGPGLLSDIRQTITRVAGMPDNSQGAKIPSVHQELPRRGGTRLKRGTFTAANWAVGAAVVVTIQGETNTVSVTNYCIPVKGQTSATQTLNVIYGDVMGTMTAVEIQQSTSTCSNVLGGVDLTALPGFSAGSIQLLGHSAGNTNSEACVGLQWYSITQCATT
jgi:hypothetical protein